MTILCEPDHDQAALLTPALPGQVLRVPTLPELALTLHREPAERLVVIGAAVEFEPVLSFSGHLRGERPDARVILLRDEVDPRMAAEATQAGVHEIVPTGYPDLLAEAFDRADTESTSDPDGLPHLPYGHIVTVFSAKGGTGKTTLATNLAVALGNSGKRSVCLVDLDLAFGDVAISLQLAPRRTLVDAVDAGRPVDSYVENLLTPLRPSIDCVLAPVEPGDVDRIPAALVGTLLTALQTRYDYIVIDTPSQFSEHVLTALDVSHHHVLLTTPEIPALKNLRLTLDMFSLLDYQQTRSIVLNRCDSRGGVSAKDAEQAISSKVTAAIPASHEVPASINRGVPIVDALPDHPVSRAITAFAADAVARDSLTVAAASPRHGLRLRKRSG